MDLFDNKPYQNRLPYDGELIYYEHLLPLADANHYLKILMETIAWRNDEAYIYGKHIVTQRKVAWYADKNFAYTYSKTTKIALPWTKELLELKALVEKQCKTTFNSCLLNLYHSGEEGMSWHSDDEKALGKDTCIASVSLGAERKFSVKHKETKESLSLVLAHGSLLVMQGAMQTHWLHALPKTKKVRTARINLTFRTIIES